MFINFSKTSFQTLGKLESFQDKKPASTYTDLKVRRKRLSNEKNTQHTKIHIIGLPLKPRDRSSQPKRLRKIRDAHRNISIQNFNLKRNNCTRVCQIVVFLFPKKRNLTLTA